MYDFSKRLGVFHDEHVRLTNTQRSDMRDRRETNFKRICDGLAELKKPALVDTINQGGYAQKTMVQPPEGDEETRFDIDMGVVFDEVDAIGALTTRNWVKDAVAKKATNMKNDPECKPKCVRVTYADGYQCDFPVFRRKENGTEWKYELSAGSDWVASDPASMNKWIEKQIIDASPDSKGGYQLRRIIRFVKYLAKVRAYHSSKKYPGGLLASALAIECYYASSDRDDISLRETLRAIGNRSNSLPVFADGIQISDDKDSSRISRFIDDALKMAEALDKLDKADADDTDARTVWRKVFRHSFFDETSLETKSATSAGINEAEILDRMREEAAARNSIGQRSSPWST